MDRHAKETLGSLGLKAALVLSLSVTLLHGQQVVAGEPGAADQIVNRVTVAQVKAFMQGEGYAVEMDANGSVVWKIDGMITQIFVFSDGESIQFSAAFKATNTPLGKVNEWNRTRRFGRAYLDEEGDSHLESDLDLAGGVTSERIRDFLKTCRVLYQAWCTEVVK